MTAAAQPDVMNFLNEVSSRFPAAISLATGRPTEQFFDRLHPGALLDALTRYEQHALRDASAADVRTRLLQYGRTAGIIAGLSLTAIALLLLYGVGFALRRKPETPMPKESRPTPLKSKIEQMLTEARVIIPGGQALLGFQLIATLTKAFSELPAVFKYVHCAGLCAVALSVVLLMTPAAVHRIAFHGEDDPDFFKIGSRLVVAASIPLAIGISADLAVVFFKTTNDATAALASGLIALVALLGFWLIYPISRKRPGQPPARQH